MDTKRACEVLNVREPFKEQDLKRAWRMAALKHHPDKSSDPDSERRFIEAQEAYAFLTMSSTSTPTDEESFVRELLQALRDSVFGDSGRDLILDMFRRLERTKAAKILDYAEKYADLFQFETSLISEMRTIMETESEVVIIHPTIENLLHSDIYCLEHRGTTLYIPMWHQEVTYDRVVVRCYPELPQHMLLDEKGVLHVTIKTKAGKVFDSGGINVDVGEKVFFICGENLRFTRFQKHTFESSGVPLINQRDSFDNSKRGNIVVHIELI